MLVVSQGYSWAVGIEPDTCKVAFGNQGNGAGTGILPKYQDEWVAVQAQRREQYEYVKRSIDVITGLPAEDPAYGVYCWHGVVALLFDEGSHLSPAGTN